LIDDGLVLNAVGTKDKRERHLSLTDAGRELEQALSNAQRDRMRTAYRQAGAEAVYGFCTVLEAMMDPDLKKHYDQLTSGETV
jgi:DNA-binding MarR family transcriptional regulator